jgi:SAM-dependent methyltransferase
MGDVPCKRILEIGCYHGSFLSLLDGEATLVVGIDPDVNAVARGTKSSAKVKWAAAFGEQLPFKDDSFDSVIMLDVLEHVWDEKQVIREIGRVLIPEGSLVLSTPHQGLFAWLDVLNFKIYFPRLYQACVRLSGRDRASFSPIGQGGRIPANPGGMDGSGVHTQGMVHRHYSIAQLQKLLEGFQIEVVLRTGLVIFPLAVLVATLMERTLRFSPRWVMRIAGIEDSFSFGPLAYNLALRARRVSGANRGVRGRECQHVNRVNRV